MSTKWTEQTVLDALEKRHRKPGNGGSGEYAFLRHVRSDAGFDARRTFDAVAVHLWPSRGFVTDVIEVKVARSDWLRELGHPSKAEEAHRVGDRFLIAAPAGIVKREELPPGWGLLEVSERGVRQVVQPERVTGKRETFPAGFVVAMLRSAGAAGVVNATEGEVRRLVDEALADERANLLRRIEEARRSAREGAEQATRFANAAGLRNHMDETAYARELLQAYHADSNRAALVATLRHQRDRMDQMLRDLEDPS